MQINYNPNDYIVESSHKTCSYHQANPGANFAGCTCMSSYSLKPKTIRPEQLRLFDQNDY